MLYNLEISLNKFLNLKQVLVLDSWNCTIQKSNFENNFLNINY